ncbi:DMT family transporter [Haladaptatus sp. T7]|uniref:DMT family transporter n=1 Tax=Haladaptatus sp. T7 TaxID=2029368 RepID=UPI00223019E7|nr:DMT family transporter [Haladaptatus sp. T7]
MASRRDIALYLSLAAVWGTAFPATKAALDGFPPVALAAVRFSLAAFVLFAVAAATGRSLRPRGRGDWTPVLVGGVFNIGLHHALLFAGQVYVTSAVASTLLGLVPVLTPVVTSAFRPEESISVRGAVGVLLGFVGVVLIANPSAGNFFSDVGVWFVLGAAVAWVVGAVFTDEDDAGLSGLSLQAWMLAVGALALDAAAFVVPGQGFAAAAPTTSSFVWVLYLAVVPGALGFLVYFRLLHRLGPIEMGLIEYVIPPFAAVFGWLVLGEGLTPTTGGGFLAILCGFLLVKWPRVVGGIRGYVDGRAAGRTDSSKAD